MKKRWGRLLGAAIVVVLGLTWLFRQPIAEGIGGAICAQQKLNCVIRLSRLDLGGLTVTQIEVKNPQSGESALSASKLAIDFDWTSPFSVRVSRVGGDALTLHLDLSGTRPLLGDLDAIVKSFTKPNSPPGKLPKIELKDVRIVGDTPLGPVEARGHVIAASADDFTVDMSAPQAKLSLPGADIDLRTGELHAIAKGGNISGKLNLDLARFTAGRSTLSDVKMDVTLEQAAGVLTGKGAASAREIKLRESHVAGAEAEADIESGAVSLETFTLQSWLPNVRKLNLTATSGEGSVAGVAWKTATAKAQLDPKTSGGSSGTATFNAAGVAIEQGAADALDVTLDLDASPITAGKNVTIPTLTAKGIGRVRGGAISADMRAQMVKVISDALADALPAFASAGGSAISRAGEKFDVVLPAAFSMTQDGVVLSALTGTQIAARSGMTVVADGEGADQVVTFNAGKATSWTAQGSLRLSGGGGPDLKLAIDSASGDGEKLAAAGSADFRSWRVGDDVIAAQARNLKFAAAPEGGSTSGDVNAELTGGVGGGVWTRARASGAINASWTPEVFSADAPAGLALAWDEGRYGDMKIGAGALRYLPAGGRLAENKGGLHGGGTVGAFEMPVTGSNFSAGLKVGATSVNWTSVGQLKASFDTKPELTMKLSERVIPVALGDLAGVLELGKGWRLTGGFKDGTVQDAEGAISGLKGAFDLSGQGEALNGQLKDVAMRIFDPASADKRKFEPTTFTGSANLAGNVANFSGLFALEKSGVQIANVSGSHSLKTGSGSLTFAPTPLIFGPSFAPKALSPLLTGPADVTGRVDIAGGAKWSPDGFKASATMELQKLGFTIASAGVFEGVSGKVVVDDLFALKSAPSQAITLDKVTLGLPIEKGVIKFQLIGFEAIRLESAEWPFVGGFIRVKPVDFAFGATENHVIAQAVDWDLAKLVEQFKLNDIKVDGVVSGDFPVTFSTGSARVDKASLSASQKGGVIQYTGSEGASAASADPNAKMLFDALKDFRYQVMKVGLDGDLAGRMVLSVSLLGKNPAVLNGAAFDLNISLDSALADLLTSYDRTIGKRLGLSVSGLQVGAPPDAPVAATHN